MVVSSTAVNTAETVFVMTFLLINHSSCFEIFPHMIDIMPKMSSDKFSIIHGTDF